MRLLATLALTSLLAACGGKTDETPAAPTEVNPAAAPAAPAPAAPAPAAAPAAPAPAPAAPAPAPAAPAPAAPVDPAAAPAAPVDPAAAPAGAAVADEAALLDPSRATATAPATFKVKVQTTKGAFVIEAYRDWAPLGVDRFYNLVKIGFF